MALDFMQQVPVVSFAVGVTIALVLQIWFPPVDEVHTHTTGPPLPPLLRGGVAAGVRDHRRAPSVESGAGRPHPGLLCSAELPSQCLIPESPQRYDENGKPYIRHKKRPEDALVECVIG